MHNCNCNGFHRMLHTHHKYLSILEICIEATSHDMKVGWICSSNFKENSKYKHCKTILFKTHIKLQHVIIITMIHSKNSKKVWKQLVIGLKLCTTSCFCFLFSSLSISTCSASRDFLAIGVLIIVDVTDGSSSVSTSSLLNNPDWLWADGLLIIWKDFVADLTTLAAVSFSSYSSSFL